MADTGETNGHTHEIRRGAGFTEPSGLNDHVHQIAPGANETGPGSDDGHTHAVLLLQSRRVGGDPSDDLQLLAERSTRTVLVALDELALAKLRQDQSAVDFAFTELANILAESRTLADLMGRRRLWAELDAKVGPRVEEAARSFSLRTYQNPISSVPFQEAIDALLSREPRLAVGVEEAQAVYTQEHGFVLARSADLVLTERIQDTLGQQIQIGVAPDDAIAQLQLVFEAHDAPQTRGYVQTVYRTNLSTAFNAGRMRQARDPAVRAIVPGFRYDAVRDVDVRDNHLAADGLVAAQDDPVWQRLSPPLGFNCRCTLALATRQELQRAGVIQDGRTFAVQAPAGAHADEGFRKLNRTDAEVYPAGPVIAL